MRSHTSVRLITSACVVPHAVWELLIELQRAVLEQLSVAACHHWLADKLMGDAARKARDRRRLEGVVWTGGPIPGRSRGRTRYLSRRDGQSPPASRRT